MSHPFGNLLSQHLHRKHGMSQSKLASGILQDPTIITKMSKGERLNGQQARERVLAIIMWLHEHELLCDVHEADALLSAAGMAPLRATLPHEAKLLERLAKATVGTVRLSESKPPQVRLPIPSTPFIGRINEIQTLHKHLSDARCRILTLVGPGGVGKTRLAIEVASAISTTFANGVYFVDLQPAPNVDALPFAIASALQVALSSDDNTFSQLEKHLARKQVLLVLDNFEHLAAGAIHLSHLITAAPSVKLLVTSREVLSLAEEWQCRIAGIDFPKAEPTQIETDRDPADYDAVRLFIECAHRAQPDLSLTENQFAIARICQLTEGMPLAIELAAAWTRTLSCVEIMQQLEKSLAILIGRLRNGAVRHRSMEVTFEHSWRMLTEKERSVFAQLTVFSGGFNYDAATSVADADLESLSALVDKSFLQFTPSGRYRIHELLRQFGNERLAEFDVGLAQTKTKHSRFFASFLERQIAPRIPGKQLEASALCKPEMDNLFAAWQWAINTQDLDKLYCSITPIFWICQYQNRYLEILNMLERSYECLSQSTHHPLHDPVQIQILAWYAWACLRCGRFQTSERLAQKCLELEESTGFRPRLDWANDSTTNLGILAAIRGEYYEAKRLALQAIKRAQESSQSMNLPVARYAYANAALALGEIDTAETSILEAIRLCKDFEEKWFLAYSLNTLGDIKFTQGDLHSASTHYETAFALRKLFDDLEGMALALNNLGKISIYQQDGPTAQTRFEQSQKLYNDLNDPGGLATAINGLGEAACLQGQFAVADQHFAQALQIAQEIGFISLTMSVLLALTKLLLRSGRSDQLTEVLTLLLHHPAADIPCRQHAQQLCNDHNIRIPTPDTKTDWQSRLEKVCDKFMHKLAWYSIA